MQKVWFQSIVAFLFCLVIFSLLLGNRPLSSPDETRYSSVTIGMVHSHDYITPKVNQIKFLDKPILFYWVQAASIHIFGLNNWSLRLVSALFAALGCLALFLLAMTIYDPKTAWLAVLMLIASPLYFISAHYINMDMMIAALITSCLCCFYGAFITKKKSQQKLLLYGCYIFAALGFLTKGLIGFALPALVILVWIILERQWSVFKWIFSPVGIILFLIITLPWYVAVQHANPEFFHYFFIFEQFDRFSQSGFNNPMPWWFYLPVIVLFLFPWSTLIVPSVIYAFKYESVAHQSFLLTWIIVILVFFSIPQSKIITYILPIFPPLVLLLASNVRLVNKNKRYVAILSLINVLLYVIVTIALLLSLIWYQYFQAFIHSKIYFYSIIIFLAVTTLINFKLYLKQNWMTQLVVTGLSMIILFWLLILGIQWPQVTIKPIAKKLQVLIKPTDDLVTFEMYPYALQLYLDHPIIVVTAWNQVTLQNDNWKGHFWYNATPEQKQQLLFMPKQFWQLWHSSKKVYVIMDLDTFKNFQNKGFNAKQMILKTSKEVLLVNQ